MRDDRSSKVDLATVIKQGPRGINPLAEGELGESPGGGVGRVDMERVQAKG